MSPTGEQRFQLREKTEGGGGGVTGKEGEGSSQGSCIKDPWTKTRRSSIEYGRWGVGRARKNNEGKMGTTVIE